MTILIIGLLVLLGIHCLPMLGGPRNALKAQLGDNGYRGVFSLVAATGLGLIIWGMASAPFEAIYNPPGWGRSLAIWMMPVVFVLLAAANIPCNLRRLLKHPMLIATVLWAAVHLLANGDLASILLFGSFAIWALLDLLSASLRSRPASGASTPPSRDALAVIGGLLAYASFLYLHGWLFGITVT